MKDRNAQAVRKEPIRCEAENPSLSAECSTARSLVLAAIRLAPCELVFRNPARSVKRWVSIPLTLEQRGEVVAIRCCSAGFDESVMFTIGRTTLKEYMALRRNLLNRFAQHCAGCLHRSRTRDSDSPARSQAASTLESPEQSNRVSVAISQPGAERA